MADIDVLLKDHEDVKERADDMELFRLSYVGGSPYKGGGFLSRHALETRSSYQKRIEASVFVNYSAPIIDIFNSYLYREPPRRRIGLDSLGKSSNESLHQFWENSDLKGRSYNTIMREVSRWASVYGFMGVIVDKPVSADATNRAEELSYGVRPYLVLYKPSDIVNWEYEENYNGPPVLSALVLREASLVENTSVYRIWRRNTWELWRVTETRNGADAPPEQIDAGVNELGVIPFVLFRNKDDLEEMSGVSDLVDVAQINRRIYEIDSNAIEIINRTAFPFLEVPVDELRGPNDSPVVVGTGNVLERSLSDGVGHRWLEPNHASLQRLLEWRKQGVEDIKETSKMGGMQLQMRQGSGVASGPALEVRFQQLNAVLAGKAGLAEQGEENILRLVAMWEAMDAKVEVQYPRKFGIRDIIADLDTAIRAKAVIMSPVYDKLIQKSLAGKTLVDFGYSGDTIKQVEVDIDKQEYVPGTAATKIVPGVTGVSEVPMSDAEKQAMLDAQTSHDNNTDSSL